MDTLRRRRFMSRQLMCHLLRLVRATRLWLVSGVRDMYGVRVTGLRHAGILVQAGASAGNYTDSRGRGSVTQITSTEPRPKAVLLFISLRLHIEKLVYGGEGLSRLGGRGVLTP